MKAWLIESGVEMTSSPVAIVAGGASGIGEATAGLFARRGWRVIIADKNVEGARRVAAELNTAGASTTSYELDVTSDAAVEVFADVAIREAGTIHAFVNSTGILENAVRVTRMPMQEYDDILNVNLRGAVLLAKAIGTHMCEQGNGSIVHLCSMASIRPSGQPAYAVSKAGLKMLTEIMAAEFGPHGVRVNSVAPGYTMTPTLRQRIESGERDPALVLARSALKRFVDPIDVAEAILFLCSKAARSITGVMLPVDCGWIAYSSYSAYATMPPSE